MTTRNQSVLCHYHYDGLDRLASRAPAASDSIQRFYQKSLLATEVQGHIQRSLLQSEDQLLAQLTRRAAQIECALLGADQQRSVLNTAEYLQIAYTPYGTRHPALDLPGFNGEQPDPVTGHYLLGNGYRAFNPILMRFNSPDSLSPFSEGGINAYAYCAGDPVNRVDPSGHSPFLIQSIQKLVKAVTSFLSVSRKIPLRPSLKTPTSPVRPAALVDAGTGVDRLAATYSDKRGAYPSQRINFTRVSNESRSWIDLETFELANRLGSKPMNGREISKLIKNVQYDRDFLVRELASAHIKNSHIPRYKLYLRHKLWAKDNSLSLLENYRMHHGLVPSRPVSEVSVVSRQVRDGRAF